MRFENVEIGKAYALRSGDVMVCATKRFPDRFLMYIPGNAEMSTEILLSSLVRELGPADAPEYQKKAERYLLLGKMKAGSAALAVVRVLTRVPVVTAQQVRR